MAVASSLVNKTSPFKNTFLILALGVIGLIFIKTLSSGSQHEKSAAHSHALIECYRVEIMMRMVDAMSYFPKVPTILKADTNAKTLETDSKFILPAINVLEKATKAEPDDAIILSKKIILKNKADEDIKADLIKLSSIIVPENKELALTIQSIYGHQTGEDVASEKALPTDAIQIINNNLSDGWFREQASLQVYKINHQVKQEEDLQSVIQSRTWTFLFKILFITLAGVVAALIGTVILLYQLFIDFKESSSVDKERNKPTTQLSQNGSSYDWQTVGFVFVAWYFTQIAIGVAYSLIQHKSLGLQFSHTNSLGSAASIALIYLLSNGPALLYIYFIALRPKGQKFIDGINLRLKAGNYGTISLITIGILGWFAAVPIVMGAYFISATFFSSSGSSNPIIAIVMQAAQANNLLTIAVFYFILGVLAPLCEETLFRGFFYTHLRTRHGVIASNLISSALFAIAHMDIGAALPLFCLGSIFACVYEKTKSILPSMIAHGLWNSATFTWVLLLFGG